MTTFVCEKCAYACKISVNGSVAPKACPYPITIPEWINLEESK